MKHQALFSLKNKSKKKLVSSAAFLFGTFRVKFPPLGAPNFEKVLSTRKQTGSQKKCSQNCQQKKSVIPQNPCSNITVFIKS